MRPIGKFLIHAYVVFVFLIKPVKRRIKLFLRCSASSR